MCSLWIGTSRPVLASKSPSGFGPTGPPSGPCSCEVACVNRKTTPNVSCSTHPAPPSAEAILDDQEDAEPDPVATESHPRPAAPLPMWITAGLVCIACGQRTVDWQNAAPDQDRCVCRACFARGVRLADRP